MQRAKRQGDIRKPCAAYVGQRATQCTRPYKPSWSAQRAQAFILEQSGQHFDPHLVQVIQGCFEQIEQYFESSTKVGVCGI